jgi:hypothetical protein
MRLSPRAGGNAASGRRTPICSVAFYFVAILVGFVGIAAITVWLGKTMRGRGRPSPARDIVHVTRKRGCVRSVRADRGTLSS